MSDTSDEHAVFNSPKTGQLRMSLLNVEDEMTALHFRSWLRRELQDLQSRAKRGDMIFVRLYMPNRLRAQITQRKLDVMLQSFVERFPAVCRIETAFAPQMLGLEEMAEEQRNAALELESIAAEIREFREHLEVIEDKDDDAPTSSVH